MEFRRHPEGNTDAVVTHQVPDHLKRYELLFAKVWYIKCAEGEILSQKIVGKHFDIWVHHFFLTEDVTLYAFVDHLCRTLNYTQKGNVWCEMIGYGKVNLKEGLYGLFCVPVGVAHPCHFTAGEYCYLHIDLQDELLSRIDYNPYCKDALQTYLKDPKNNGIQLKACSMHPVIRTVIRSISSCNLKVKDAYDAMVIYHVEQLLYEFNKQISEIKKETDQQLMVAKMEEIALLIEGNLKKKYTLKSLAKDHQMTPLTLHRNFKKLKGMSVKKFAIKCKMESAQVLLATTELSVAEIAEEVGYSEPGDLARAYKKYFTWTPLEEREKCRYMDGVMLQGHHDYNVIKSISRQQA